MNKLSDCTELNNEELKNAYKKYEPSIKMLRFWEINFYIILSIISFLLYLYFKDSNIDISKLSLTVLFFSLYYIWNRKWYKKWFLDWYEGWYSDWSINVIKNERNLTDEDITVIQDIEISNKINNI